MSDSEEERHVDTQSPEVEADGSEAEVASETNTLLRDLDELRDRHLRLAAEFDNYRRRSQVQLGESAARAQAQLVQNLLEVLDDFSRVRTLDPESASVEAVLDGVSLVERKLSQLLEDAGLETLDPEGAPFDPNEMEALVRVPADSMDEDDLVDQVLQKGFRFSGHLLRPARVSVRKYE